MSRGPGQRLPPSRGHRELGTPEGRNQGAGGPGGKHEDRPQGSERRENARTRNSDFSRKRFQGFWRPRRKLQQRIAGVGTHTQSTVTNVGWSRAASVDTDPLGHGCTKAAADTHEPTAVALGQQDCPHDRSGGRSSAPGWKDVETSGGMRAEPTVKVLGALTTSPPGRRVRVMRLQRTC